MAPAARRGPRDRPRGPLRHWTRRSEGARHMISISPPPHRIRLRRLTACAGLVCALAVCLSPPAAHAEPVFAIKPATATATNYFVLPLVPGSFVTRKVKVSNVGDTAGVVRLFGVDATTGQTTGAVYLGSER